MSPASDAGSGGGGEAPSEAGQDTAQNARQNNTTGPFGVVPKNPFDFSDDEGDDDEKSGKKQRGMLYRGPTDAELSEIESQQSQNRFLSSREDGSLPKGSKDGGSSLQNEYNLSRAEERRQFMEVMGGGSIGSSKHEETPLFDDGDNGDGDGSDNDPGMDARTMRSATVENYGDGNVYDENDEYEPSIDESLEKYATMRQVMDGSDRESQIDVHRRGGRCAKCAACFESPCCNKFLGERRTQRRKVSVAILVCMIVMFVVAGLVVYFVVIRGASNGGENGTRGREPENATPPSSMPTPAVNNSTNVTSGIADNLNSTVADPANATDDTAATVAEGSYFDWYREQVWSDLPAEIREAAVALGYDEGAWNEGIEPESRNTRWNELPTAMREAALLIGYTIVSWDADVDVHDSGANDKDDVSVSTSAPSLAPISESTSTPSSNPNDPSAVLGNETASPTVGDGGDNGGGGSDDSSGNNTNATAFPTFQIMLTPTYLPSALGDTPSSAGEAPSPAGNASAPTASPTISFTLDELSYPYVMSQQMESPLMPSLSRYGSSMAISGDGRIVAAGATEATNESRDASGAVYLHSLKEGSDEPSLLQAIYGRSANDEFGNAVALSEDGNRMVVGSRSENDQLGAIRIYQKDDGAGTPDDAVNYPEIATIVGGADDGATATQYPSSSRWSPMEGGLIQGSSPGGRAGWSVSISADGNVVAMGSPKGGSNGGGSITTYKYDGLTLVWEPYGSTIQGLSSGEEAGYSISLSEYGSTMVIGSPKVTNLDGTINMGKTAVYIISGSEWQLLGQELHGEAEDDMEGTAVAMSRDGSIVVIGGKGRNEANATTGEVVLRSVGHCSIHQIQAGQLVFQHSIVGKGSEERLGSSVAVSSDGNVVACGGVGGVKGNSAKSGVVRLWNQVTTQESTIWPRGEVADLDGATFGTSLAISADGEYVIVGAPSWSLKNGGATSAGAVQVFRYAT